MNEVLLKRVKSFVWRLSVVLGVAAVEFMVADVTGWGLSQQWVVFIGLVGGEVTKWLNSK